MASVHSCDADTAWPTLPGAGERGCWRGPCGPRHADKCLCAPHSLTRVRSSSHGGGLSSRGSESCSDSRRIELESFCVVFMSPSHAHAQTSSSAHPLLRWAFSILALLHHSCARTYMHTQAPKLALIKWHLTCRVRSCYPFVFLRTDPQPFFISLAVIFSASVSCGGVSSSFSYVVVVCLAGVRPHPPTTLTAHAQALTSTPFKRRQNTPPQTAPVTRHTRIHIHIAT